MLGGFVGKMLASVRVGLGTGSLEDFPGGVEGGQGCLEEVFVFM
jgi:hypothetical protein